MTAKTSDLCDACAEAVACVLPLRSYGRRRSFAGTIRTIRCHDDIALMRDAVAQPGHDQVLVIDGGGSLARALFGDVMAAIAVRNGWAGLVIHGAIRDSVEIDTMDIGVKALGTAPRRGERTGAGDVGVPVQFGGVTFTPGLRLVADEDGVIVLPAGVSEADIAVEDALAATAAYVGQSALENVTAAAARPCARRAAIVRRPMAFVPSKPAQAGLEPRHSAPRANTGVRSTKVNQ